MSTRDVPGTKPKRGIDLGQILMGAMVALALLTGVIGLFSGSANALKLAMLIALWACVVAGFLVATKRKQYDEDLLKNQRSLDADRLRAQQDYQRQLNEQRDETLDNIRTQLDAMRNQLEELSGAMLAYEPAALKAEARRLSAIELESSQGGASLSKEAEALIPVVPEPVEVDVEDSFISEPLAKKPEYLAQPFAKPAAGPTVTSGATAAPRFNSGAFSSTRWDAGGIEKNTPQPEARHATESPFRPEPGAQARPQPQAPRVQQVRPDMRTQAPKPKPQPQPAANAVPTEDDSLLRSRRRSAFWPEPEKPSPRPAPAAPKPQPKPEPARPAAATHRSAPPEPPKRPAPEPVVQPVSHAAAQPRARGGRRRRDEHQQGVSVADLLKNLKQ